MPEQSAELAETDPQAMDPESNAPARKSLLSRLGLVAILALIVAGECAAAFLVLPDPQKTAEMAAVAMSLEPGEKSVDLKLLAKSQPKEEEELTEVDLGEFTITAFQPLSNTTIRIDFHLYGTVHRDDEESFLTAMEHSKHRFRDQVIVTVRSSKLDDMTDAGLGLIKRKILEKTNRTLGSPFLQTIIFSDFSFIEQ